MSSSSTQFAAGTGSSRRPRVVFFVNGIFSEQIGGGDIFFAYIARAALAAGYPLHFFGGHALKRYLEREGLPLNLTLTDSGMGRLGDTGRLNGQLRLLLDFSRRFVRTMRLLSEVQPDDIAYGVSEYWFDTIPVMRCRARHKAFHLGMMAPRLGEVLFKSRADVTTLRLAAFYFWLSQQFSGRLFRFCRGGVITYPHPEIRDYLMRFGQPESGLWYIPNGSDVALADRVPPQPKQFDVAWMGRVHPQKGIDDLLATLAWLKQQVPDFRAVIIGKSQDKLEPVASRMGLAGNVTFSGLVSEEEKFRLLKSSRVFVMPSRYESWGIVVGEAIASGVPVVAYDLPCYRPVFGDFVRYVKCFDSDGFKRVVEDEVRQQRAGRNFLAGMNPDKLKQTMDWSTAQESFLALLRKLAGDGVVTGRTVN
jgi:glycosyltransferase involved in cell wall biosynthesis